MVRRYCFKVISFSMCILRIFLAFSSVDWINDLEDPVSAAPLVPDKFRRLRGLAASA
jgi:hypothetical protein